MVLEVVPASLSSAVHVVEPVFYVRCIHGTVKVSSFYFQPKGKVRRICMQLVTAGRVIVYSKPLPNEFLDEMNLISGETQGLR